LQGQEALASATASGRCSAFTPLAKGPADHLSSCLPGDRLDRAALVLDTHSPGGEDGRVARDTLYGAKSAAARCVHPRPRSEPRLPADTVTARPSLSAMMDHHRQDGTQRLTQALLDL